MGTNIRVYKDLNPDTETAKLASLSESQLRSKYPRIFTSNEHPISIIVCNILKIWESGCKAPSGWVPSPKDHN
jgi:hypothetical protein